MSLDINTPKGQISLQHEQSAIEAIRTAFPDITIIQTPKELESDADGFLVVGGVLKGLFESKCRALSVQKLQEFNNEWLVTYDKIVRCCELSKRLCIPFYGFLYLLNDKALLSVRISDEKGNIIVPMRIERTQTQRTVNGGEIVRTNAYINMGTAKKIA